MQKIIQSINNDSPKSSFLHNEFLRFFGLFVSLILLSIIWQRIDIYYNEKHQEIFSHTTQEHLSSLQNRFLSYELLLQSGIGFFHGSDDVTREEWHHFVSAVHLQDNSPGVKGVGYSLLLREDEAQLLSSAILFLEPMDKRNQNAIGYDMFSEPVRQEAMIRAAESGKIALSAKVTLVQEIDEDIQAGILMYMPYFKEDKSLGLKHVVGYVYSPFRMNDLINSVAAHRSSFFIEIYDASAQQEEHLLYRSLGLQEHTSKHQVHSTLDIGGKTWYVHYYSSPSFEKNYDTKEPILYAIFGSIIYLLLLFIIIELLKSRSLLKEKAKELALSFEWLDRLFQSSVDCIHILDTQGNLIEYSPSFLNMLGYSKSEASRLQVFDWEAKLSKQTALKIMENLSSEAIVFESIFKRKDGTFIDVEIKAQTFMENDKKLILASAWDITQRKENERMLRYEKEMAQTYLDIVEVMILVINPDYTIRHINPKGCQILGFTAQEAIGKNFVELFVPTELRSEIGLIVNKLINHDGYEYHENIILTKNGEERLIAWKSRPLLDENGLISGILSSGEDITELRNAQKSLLESEVFYKTVFASITDAILVIQEEKVIDCNDLALTLLATTKELLLHSDIYELFSKMECKEKNFPQLMQVALQERYTTSECLLTLSSAVDDTKIIEFTISTFGDPQEQKLI
ncbi:MAG: CHASE domain-containing protein, partial [Sulfurimonas sp.]|nr:CHASE domain-containing protein [Sulfurimonas sp.]